MNWSNGLWIMELHNNLGWKGSLEVIWSKYHSRQRELQSYITLLKALSGISSNGHSTASLVNLFQCITNLIVKMCLVSTCHAVPLGESHTNSHQEGQYLTCKEADASCFHIRLMMMVVDHMLPSPTQLSSVELFKSFSLFLNIQLLRGREGRGGTESREGGELLTLLPLLTS